MYMNMAKDFCQRLNIDFCDKVVPFYEKGIKMKESLGTAIVDEDRLKKLNSEYKFFRKWFDDLLCAASIIKEDEDLLLFNYILCNIIKERADVNILPVPDRESIETDFAPIFALLWFVEDIVKTLKDKGLPFKVISDTLHGFEAEIDDYYNMYGRSGVRVFVSWFMHYIKCEIIRVGRLNFEFASFNKQMRVYQKGDDIKILADGVNMHRRGMVFGSGGQDDEEGKFFAEINEENGIITGYAANEFGECVPEKITLEGYEEVLKDGDEVLSVHIPADEPFTTQLCEEAYKGVLEIIKKCYPEKDIKAFVCYSWMLEKRLKEIMGKETNITRFADMFTAFPICSAGAGVVSFLFHSKASTDFKDLPENTSMQRAVKKYLCDGNYFYEKGGVMLF